MGLISFNDLGCIKVQGLEKFCYRTLPPWEQMPEVQKNWTQLEMMQIVATTSMLLAFLENDDEDSTQHLLKLEQLMKGLTVMLQSTGNPLFMKSALFLWECGSNCLTQWEKQRFPDQPLETPQTLVVPSPPRSLLALRDPEWQQYHLTLGVGQAALRSICTWIWAHYCTAVHRDCFEIWSDCDLLYQMALNAAGIVFEA